MNDNSFHHVAITYDGAGTGQVYVDGQAVTTIIDLQGGGTPGPLDSSAQDAQIGNWAPATVTPSFIGVIDEVKIHDRALNSAEILATAFSAGNEAVDNFMVTVEDTTSPTFTVFPSPVTIEATSPDGEVHNFTVEATDTVNPDPVVGCFPPSGAQFNLGVTTVTCSANDAFPGDSVSWWPGEGNADDAADSNNGTLENGVIFAPGRVGQAFSFDGGATEHIPIPYSASLNLTQLTISAWIQADSDVSTGRTISAKDANDGQPVLVRNWWFGLCTPSGLACDPGQLLFSGTTTESGSRVFWSFTGGVPLNDGVLHHVAVTYDGVGSAQIFIDGSPVSTTSIQGAPGAPDFTNEPAYIGNLTPAANNSSFLGLIDEVRIYNRALSSDEVLQPLTPRCRGRWATSW